MINKITQTRMITEKNSFGKFTAICCLLLVSLFSFSQTNPTAQTLPYTQNFGTATFTTMPTGTAAWNGLNGGSVTTQALAEASTPTGNATLSAATAATGTGGSYGYSVSSNAAYYIQTSSNATNGVNQLVTSINTGSTTSVVVSYDIRVISIQTAIMGVVLQYRLGTSGSWTTVAGSAVSYNNATSNKSDADSNGDTDNYSFTINGLTASSAYQFRWATWKGTGTGTGLGIDNLSFTAAASVDWCNIQSPTSQSIEESGTFTVYAQAYEPGLTEAAGAGSGLSGWIGISPIGSNTNPNTWTNWVAASFNVQSGNNDEFMATIGSGLTPGTYYYASRFQIGSGPYVYGGTGGVWSSNSGVLTVTSKLVTWGNLQYPASGTITQGGAFNVYGQVYHAGITDSAGQGSGITAQVGYSTNNTNPNTWTNWASTTYNGDSGNNDEYVANIGASLAPGTYYYATRYQRTGSTEYVYGGTGGIWNNDSGVLTVNPAAPVVTAGSPTGTYNTSFTYNIVASNSPTSYALSSGSFPPGLTLNTSTGEISGTPTSAGSFIANVTASNAGGTSAPAALNFTINKANQTITFAALSAKTYGDAAFTLTGTASSGLTVSYASSNTAVATVSGNTVTIVGAGTTNITASQAGDANYNPATDVVRSLTVNPKALTITGVTANNKVQDGTTAATLSGTPTLNGVVTGDEADVTISGTPTATFASATPGTGIAVTVTGYTLSGAKASFYTVSQPTGLTADITGLGAPTANAATAILPTGFTANWSAVTGASSYRLDVSTSSSFIQNLTRSTDDFESGTLSNWNNTSNWSSSNSVPVSGTYSLRLNAPAAQTTSYIYTQPTSYNLSNGDTTWRFNIKTNYAPSTNNRAFYYLTSNQTTLTSASGYVVGFNFVGSDDLIKLCKSASGTGTALISSTTAVTSGTVYGIEVTRSKTGLWTLKIKSGGGFTGMTVVGTSTDTTYTDTSYTGLVSYSSSSNNQNLRFDDFSITQLVSDALPGYDDLNVGNVTSYAVTGLSPETTYYYRVRAVNGSVASANSNVVSVTTKPTSCTWNGSAWSNTTGPDADIEAVIAGVYSTTANGEFTAKKVTVNSGSLTVNTGDTITIINELVNTLTAADVVVENNANLLQGGTTNSNSGAITVNRSSSSLLRLDYTLWSSPVASQNLLSFSPNTLTNRFYTYNTNTNLYNAISSPSTTSFDTAKGYLIRVPNNHPSVTPTVYNGVFAGVPNNGNITFTMVDGGAGQRFNAVGNPYPSPIDAVDFVTGNSNITGTLYFWRKTNNTASPSYCTWTTGGFVSNNEAQVYDPNDVIQTGQGFFVEANGSGTSLSFDNNMRIDNHANQFFRVANTLEKHRLWLNVTNGAGLFSQTMIGYIENATNGFDAAIDGRYINDGEVALTTMIDNVDYAIQGKSLPFDATDVVPLKLSVTTAGNYTISLDHVDGLFSASQDIFLRDNQTGFVQDLKAGSYSFTSDAGTFASRFDVIYQSPLGVENPSLNNQLVVYNNGVGEFVVNSGSIEMKSIKVFDLRGRLLNVFDNINSTQTKVSGGNANGVLLLQITSTDGAVVTKKVIR